MGVALDEPTARDEIYQDGDLIIVVKRYTLRQIGEFLIEWYGDRDTGWVSARPIASSGACSLR